MKEKSKSEHVVEFCVELSRRMILCGANVGFVLSSIIAHYVRRARHLNLLHKK